jgi:hypothetical protein
MMKLYGGGTAADLDEDETSLVSSFIVSFVQIYEQLYHETRGGVLGQGAFDEFPGQSIFKLRYFREEWPSIRAIFSPPIARHMEERFGISVSGGHGDDA